VGGGGTSQPQKIAPHAKILGYLYDVFKVFRQVFIDF